MRSVTLIPDPAVLTVEQIIPEADAITLVVRTTRPTAVCPDCEHKTARIHSWYTRQIQDLPWQGLTVRLRLHTRRWFCDHPACRRRIFTERLPTVALPYAQRTTRLATIAFVFGIAVGGAPGARLLGEMGVSVSGDTLRRTIAAVALPVITTPRVLGVDDWSRRKGHDYGTILVDLERHCPIDLLPDAQAATFAAWLQAHPGVEIICRDRGGAYADGARRGAPEAIQVADRWHLLANLGDVLERFLVRHHEALHRVRLGAHERSDDESPVGTATPKMLESSPSSSSPFSQMDQDRQQRMARREARYQAIHALQDQGYGIRAIARQLRIHPETVRKNLAASNCPHPGPRPNRQRRITPYLPYLRQRWKAGERSTQILWAEIREQGFTGSWKRVQDVVAPWRRAERVAQRALADSPSERPPTPPTQPEGRRCGSRQVAAWLVRSTDTLTAQQQRYLEDLADQCPEIGVVQPLARDFVRIIRTRAATELEPWLDKAETSNLSQLREFAAGIRRDQAAVQAALDYAWSSGQVEGQINRVKLIKRSMYGRASFDLLRQRVLHVA